MDASDDKIGVGSIVMRSVLEGRQSIEQVAPSRGLFSRSTHFRMYEFPFLPFGVVSVSQLLNSKHTF